MNMFPVWTLSSLILSYTLAFPIFNDTSQGSYLETFPKGAESMEHNKTRLMENNVTERNFAELNRTRHELQQENQLIKVIHLDCPLPTCSLSNLGSSLQIGDEVAGDLATNPMGIGKK